LTPDKRSARAGEEMLPPALPSPSAPLPTATPPRTPVTLPHRAGTGTGTVDCPDAGITVVGVVANWRHQSTDDSGGGSPVDSDGVLAAAPCSRWRPPPPCRGTGCVAHGDLGGAHADSAGVQADWRGPPVAVSAANAGTTPLVVDCLPADADACVSAVHNGRAALGSNRAVGIAGERSKHVRVEAAWWGGATPAVSIWVLSNGVSGEGRPRTATGCTVAGATQGGGDKGCPQSRTSRSGGGSGGVDINISTAELSRANMKPPRSVVVPTATVDSPTRALPSPLRMPPSSTRSVVNTVAGDGGDRKRGDGAAHDAATPPALGVRSTGVAAGSGDPASPLLGPPPSTRRPATPRVARKRAKEGSGRSMAVKGDGTTHVGGGDDSDTRRCTGNGDRRRGSPPPKCCAGAPLLDVTLAERAGWSQVARQCRPAVRLQGVNPASARLGAVCGSKSDPGVHPSGGSCSESLFPHPGTGTVPRGLLLWARMLTPSTRSGATRGCPDSGSVHPVPFLRNGTRMCTHTVPPQSSHRRALPTGLGRAPHPHCRYPNNDPRYMAHGQRPSPD